MPLSPSMKQIADWAATMPSRPFVGAGGAGGGGAADMERTGQGLQGGPRLALPTRFRSLSLWQSLGGVRGGGTVRSANHAHGDSGSAQAFVLVPHADGDGVGAGLGEGVGDGKARGGAAVAEVPLDQGDGVAVR